MISPDFVIKAGDTLPQLQSTIRDGDGNPIPMTGATVTLLLHGLTVLDEQTLTCTVADGPNGKVAHDWAGTETAIPGYYSGQWHVVFANDQDATYPVDVPLIIQITE